MRLPRTQSISDRKTFATIKSSGRAKAGKFLILSTLEEPSLPSIHTGFITTKRCGKAHDRNRLRRQFRALVQRHAPDFTHLQRFLVTIARPDARHATFPELEADWLRQARRLGLLRHANPPCKPPRP